METKSGNCNEKCENNDKVGHRMTPSIRNSGNCPGCGLSDLDKITITVAPTTGGRFDISVHKSLAVETLKKVISKKLKVPKERILLLHKERQLREGNLQQNSIYNGSTLTLLPSVETGLLSQRPEQGVMQALESLNDNQVNDFLSGKAPLNLTMRLGDHMMLIQLQLSSVSPSLARKTGSNLSLQPSSKSNETCFPKPNVPSTSEAASASGNLSDLDITLPNLTLIKSKISTLLHKSNVNLNALKRKLQSGEEETSVKKSKTDDDVKSRYFKDLNLKNVLLKVTESPSGEGKSTKYNDMIKESTGESTGESSKSRMSKEMQMKNEILSEIMESMRKISENTTEVSQTEEKVCDKDVNGTGSKCSANCSCSNKTGYILEGGVRSSDSAALDTKALAEASRNLTQTLKQLSSEVLTCGSESAKACSTSSSSSSRRRPGAQGAIIESMQHHGKGVFSGTFSGTLNPALQDRFGRPKRDISTIIHILNDLLSATPQYRRQRQAQTQRQPQPQPQAEPQPQPQVEPQLEPQPEIKVETQETSPVEDKDTTATTELVSVENEATRGKLERLRMVMEQNRARRRARREAKSSDNAQNEIANVVELETNKQDGAELMEITPPEPVVA